MNRNQVAISGVVLSLLLAGCAGKPNQGRVDMACHAGIETAYDELSFARSQGFSGSVAWTKASTLLGSAKVMEQVENYDSCLANVEKARFYIRQSQGK